MKINLLSLLLLIFLGSSNIFSQTYDLTLASGSPSEVGMSAERLERIDGMLQRAIVEEQIPGAVAMVVRRGKIVYFNSFGKANAQGKALEKDAVFRIASQTKAITATAVMMLWEEGKFQLDDPISKYVPEFKDPQILQTFNEADSSYTTRPAENEITIRHLITHTSGLGYGIIDGDERIRKIYQKAGVTDLFTTEDISIGESVKKLATLPLHHEPGQRFTYSEGLDVLGYLIEVISGKPLDVFLRQRIFEPLGMEDTWFYLPKNKSDRLVAVQTWKDGKWTNYPITFYDPDYPNEGARSFFSGGAGLSSTALDYAKFLQMYLNGGSYDGKIFLSPTTIEVIMSNQIADLWQGPGKDYGLAFGLINAEGEALGGLGSEGTFEWGGYFNTQYFADPEEELIGILMKQTQKTTKDQTLWKFRRLVYAAVAE